MTLFLGPKKFLIYSGSIPQQGNTQVSKACMQKDICRWHVILWNQLVQAVGVTSAFGTNSSTNFWAPPRFKAYHGTPILVEWQYMSCVDRIFVLCVCNVCICVYIYIAEICPFLGTTHGRLFSSCLEGPCRDRRWKQHRHVVTCQNNTDSHAF